MTDSASAQEGAKRFQVGNATVWAIADSTRDREMTVFEGADPAVLKQCAPSGKTPSAIIAFAVPSEDGLVLIDTGLGLPSGDRASHLLPNLAKAGLSPEKVKTVLITHMHPDHVGGLVLDGKRAFPNAVVRVGRVELDFWLDEKGPAEFPSRKDNFEAARRLADLYAGAVETFEFDAEAAPGIRALDAAGHTPGHTAFLLESAGAELVIWGDLLHAAALQFPLPEECARYDMDMPKAVASRKAILDLAAERQWPVAGMHIPFTGIGLVAKDGKGYRFTPTGSTPQ